MDRRQFLALAAISGALLARPAQGLGVSPGIKLGAAEPFPPGRVADMAARLARRPFVPPPPIPSAWTDLDYDQYRQILFRPASALWRGGDSPFEAQLFPPGFYFREGVSLALVENGTARPVPFNRDVFRFAPGVPELPASEALNYSGFRLHAALNAPDRREEFTVFQGASYFRGVGRGQVYGLSARGLAIDTAEADGEEFPIFRAFWIETPGRDAVSVRVHALLDSPSVAGAYRFDVTPGEASVMDVEAMLFPRRDLPHVGLAPLTSMFLHDATNRYRFDDFRPAVHDSEGLMVVNGNGEQLWRPLANPHRLQVSQFLDRNPRGFGLVQRSRALAAFNDLEARYDKRPSAWVEPGEGWGAGAVTLVEIPTSREINDNIVAYWRPTQAMMPGGRYRFGYRLSWCWQPPVLPGLVKVAGTAMGAKPEGGRLVVIDFEPGDANLPEPGEVVADMTIRPGRASAPVIERHPVSGGLRLAFTFDPQDANAVELRAQIRDANRRPLSEVWLYRWTN